MSSVLRTTPTLPGDTAGGARAFPDAARPLSAMQQGMLFSALLQPGAGVDVQQLVFRLREPVDAPLLAAAWQRATDRHEILRTSFRWDGLEVPEQAVWTGVAVDFAVAEWAGDPAFAAWLREDRARGFAMDRAPLQRVALFRRAADDWTLVWTFHHALLDGRGQQLILRALFADYEASLAGAPAQAAPERPFRAYLDWFHAQDFGASEGFWRGVLDGIGAATPLPGAPASAPSAPEFEQRSVRLPIAPLEALAAEHGLSLNALVQAAWAVLLARHAGADDVVFGTTRACRRSAAGGAEDVVGLVINTLPMRLRVAGASLLEVARAARAQWMEMRPHEHTPLQRIQEWSGIPGGRLFETLATFDSGTQSEQMRGWGGGWAARELHILRKPAVPLTLLAYGGAELLLTLTYDPARFPAASVDRLLGHLRAVLLAFAADVSQPASAVDLLSDEERAALAAWGDGGAAAETATVDALFAAQAARTPDAVALETEGERITYAQLDARANRLARHLRALGVGPGTRVGLSLERGAELVAATLAILKAGGAYVPLDPSYPAERLAFMLEDTAVPVLVTDSALAERLPAHAARVVRVDADAEAISAEPAEPMGSGTDPESVAYVMYTSGSTGRPKGIEVPHRAVVRLVREPGFISIAPDDVFLLMAPASFDAATLEIWGPLLNGARLAIHPAGQPSVESIGRAVAAHGVTTLWLTAGLFHLVVEERIGALRGVRQLLAGGDVLSVAHVRRVLAELPGTALINGYGPTENTTFTCCHRVDALPADAASVPVGRPIRGTRVCVLDAARRLVPVGAEGELYAGGAGLALGYLNRPELTAQSFVADPFTPGERLYRTGDRVRWTEAGAVEFLGRIDTQVKIRGFRIEPGEVEAVLLSLPGVQAAAVVVREDAPGEKRLVAYAVTADAVDDLRAALRGRLPEYMVPASVVRMDALPLTPNGKLDRRALPAPEADAAAGAQGEPRTQTEGVLAALWAQLLGLPRVGADDDVFALGAHSLTATRALSRLREVFGVELPMRAVFDAPTVRTLAAAVDAARGQAPAPAIVPVPRTGAMPLSFAQERMWVLDQVEPDRAAYVVPLAVRLRGALDAGALGRALRETVRRHEALRTTFREQDGAPVQVVWAGECAPLRTEDLSALPAEEREAALLRRAADEADRPFDLAAGPLYRFTLLRLADDDHALLLAFHHSVFDGWSVGVLFRELSALYAAFARGEASPLAQPAVQYADFAAWQRERLAGETLARDVAWWTERLGGAPALLELPTDRPRPHVRSGRGARVRAALPRELAEAVDALARREGATAYMVLLAAFQALMARYSGQDDVVVGTPVAGRTRAEAQEMIGLFVNTLALRAELGGNPTFATLLARTREATLGAFAHQELPWEKVVEALQPERTPSHAPVFQVMMTLEDADAAAPAFPGVQAELLERELSTAKFDLLLTLRRGAEGMHATLEYAADLWDAPSAARILAHFRALLAAAVAEPDRPVAHLPVLAEGDAARIAAWQCGPALRTPAEVFPVQLAARVRATPDAVALIHGGQSVTYAQLDARANRIARHLRALGVTTESRVGLCLERTPELIASLLAVLKAGGAYVPVEPHFPAGRIAQVMRDAGACLLLARGAVDPQVAAVEGLRIVDVDAAAEAIAAQPAEALPLDLHPEQLAHVIYTSGSTGQPKGVMIRHGSVGAFVAWMRDRFPLGADDRVLGSTSVGFDVHVAEVHYALAAGVPLVLVRDALALAELDPSIPLTQASMVPSAALELLRMGALPRSLARVNLGGEPLATDVTRALYEAGMPEVHNVYGPTEDTTYSTHLLVPPDARRMTVGRPLGARRAYVLDARLQPVPAGVVGEAYMAGAGVSRGYLGRPEMTAASYLPDPWGAPGERMYATGDRARWLPDGEIEYLGRADFQVKVRGFRIEPGEIEGVLRAHPAVRNAVVAARGAEGGKRLVAYVLAADASAAAAELAAHVRGRLPEYMVPAAFVMVDEFPLTSSGKIDRKALPEPEWGAEDRAFVAPRTPLEEAVAAVWAGVLGVEQVGADDDFFALGGHSLLATRVMVRFREGYGVEVPLRAVFEAPTVAAFAARIAADPEAAAQVEQMWEMMQMLSGLSDEQAAELLAGEEVAQ